MRRAAAAVIGTVAGTCLLIVTKLGLHPTEVGLAGNDTSGVAGAGGPSPAPVGDDDERAGAGTASTGPPPTRPSARASRPAGAPSTTAAPRPAPPTTAGTGLRNGSFTGTGGTERHGTITVSVSVTVSGSGVTDASLTCGGCNGQSQPISTNAFSRLRQEALQAQSRTSRRSPAPPTRAGRT